MKKMNIRRQLRLYYLKVVRLGDTPENIAKGMALGLFIGMTPTMGFQMPIALAAAALLRQNKISSLLGVWITNPLTAPAIYFFNYKVGAFAMQTKVDFPHNATLCNLLSMGSNIVIPIWVGGVVTGVVSGGLGYFVTLRSVRIYRAKRDYIRSKIQEERRVISEKLVHEKKVIMQKVHQDSQKISDFFHHKDSKHDSRHSKNDV